MKKITLLTFVGLFISSLSFAQGTCNNPSSLSPFGDTTVTSYTTGANPTPICDGGTAATAGAWFTYTATADGIITVSSNIASNPATLDTRLQVYSGSCGALVCEGENDDFAFFGNGDPRNNFRSEATISVTAGTTYYITWDNRWDPTVNFDFSVTFGSVSAAPNAVTTPDPVDGATDVFIDPADVNNDGAADNRVSIGWTPSATGDPALEFNIFFGTDPATLTNLTATSTFTGTSASITNSVPGTTYFWQIEAVNSVGGTLGPIWSYTTEAARDCSIYANAPWTIDFGQESVSILTCFNAENVVTTSPAWGYNDVNDLNGDGLDDSLMVVAAGATDAAKDDYLFGPAVDLVAGTTYTFTFSYNNLVNLATPVGTEVNSVRFLLADTQVSTGNLTVLGTNPAVTETGTFGDVFGNDLISQATVSTFTYTPTVNETLHPTVHVNTPANGESTWFLLFEMGVSGTASIDGQASDLFTLSPNPATDFIQIKNNAPINSIEIVNTLGQRVLKNATINNDRVNIESLDSGMYFIKANSAQGSKTVRFIKK